MSLAYEIWGEGPLRLVALHGFTGNRTAFNHLKPYWAEHCQVLALDLPGHGQTPLSFAPTFARTLDACLKLFDALGWHGANLVGYSLGARVALGLAIQRPELFGRLVLESGSPGLRRRKARSERRRTDEQLATSLETAGLVNFVRRWEALPLFDGVRGLATDVQESLRARRLDASAEGLAGSLRGFGLGMQPSYWTELHKLRLPTLILTGARDVKFTQTAREMAAELPSAWRRTFQDVGHAPHLEAPAEYSSEVLGFLRTPWMESAPLELETGST